MTTFSRPCLEGGTRCPSPPEIRNYLATRTGVEMVQLMQTIQDPKAQAALTAALLFAPPAVSGHATALEKAKKALNAFVGFRCYYINIPPFKEWPMKKLSQPMGTLWDSDPNKSKWSLLTKAWSIMRDQIGKDNVPLDEFFGYACPYLNIPSPQSYLNQLGWVMGLDQNGAPTVKRDPLFPTQPAGSGTADEARSVEDIIRYCQSMGYAPGFTLSPDSTSATFLGRSNATKSRTVTLKQTTPTVQAQQKRTDERNKRRVKQKLARETGISTFFHSSVENTQAYGEMHCTTNNVNRYNSTQLVADQVASADTNIVNGNNIYQNTEQTAQLVADQHASADETFYSGFHNLTANPPTGHISSIPQNSDSMELGSPDAFFDFNLFDLTAEEIAVNHNAFRVGANENAALPDMDSPWSSYAE